MNSLEIVKVLSRMESTSNNHCKFTVGGECLTFNTFSTYLLFPIKMKFVLDCYDHF